MSHITKLRILSTFVVLLLALAGFTSLHLAAQEKQPPQLPLPEMQRLAKLYVGRWEYTETYPKSAFSPNGGVNTGVYISESGPGGNSIFNHFHSKGPVGEFDGVLVMTWDPNEKTYKAYVFGDSFPAALVETGQWEGDALVYRSEFSVNGMKFALRNTTKFLEGGKLSSDEFSSVNGKPEALLVRVEAVKK
ncbi:MAG TPA: hypothetical protein VI685_16395 [Candidatus Angelobacter sp.]